MQEPSFQLPQLEWIRAFEAAARLGSFTAAARETGLTQPAISQRISQLEAHLGAQLFLRQARTITLSVEGEAWLPHVQAALQELSESSEMLFARDRTHLTFSASQSVIALWLIPRLAEVERVTGASISVQSYVLGGQSATLDEVIQIRYGAGDWPHHYQMPLYDEVLAPVAAPQLLAQGQGAGPGKGLVDWTTLPRIACTGPRPDWHAYTRAFGLPASPGAEALRFDTFHAALEAAKSGLGVALASLPLCAADLREGRLVQLGSEVLPHGETYWLLASKRAIRRRQWDALTTTLHRSKV